MPRIPEPAHRKRIAARAGLSVCAVTLLASWALAGPFDLPSEFTQRGSIANTRHNLTQRPSESLGNGISATYMDETRNDYGEVCVYCHTPHGANRTISAPLWNRSNLSTSYTTYDSLGTTSLTQSVTRPGVSSLTCLSCHDGTLAIDAVINMPGSGRYSAAMENTQNQASEVFLDSWTGFEWMGHGRLNTGGTDCFSCHTPTGADIAANFQVAKIGTDLRDDHPVGIVFPTANADFNPTTATQGSAKFFDLNGNGRMDKNEIRVYDTGDGHEVECASCHDPHGVPSGGAGSTFIPTFMRVNNGDGSALCMTCHVK